MAVAEQEAPAQVARTTEVIDAELKALGQQIGEAYGRGDHQAAQTLQISAGKLYKEMQQLEAKGAAARVMAEIGPATYNAIRPAIMRGLQVDEFKAQAVKAGENGYRNFQITVTMPTKEQLEADANAAPEIKAVWTGGASAPRRTAGGDGTRAASTVKAVTIDGERFETRAAVVDRYGSDHEKSLPDSYKSGTARGILARLEKEGHTVVVE